MRLIQHPKLAGARVLCDCGRLMSAKAHSVCGKCGNVWDPTIKSESGPKKSRSKKKAAAPTPRRKKAGLLEKQSAKRDSAKARRAGLGKGIN